VRAWVVRVLDVRDALAALPPVPVSIWFGGAAILIVLRFWRTMRARLCMQGATAAGPDVQAAVRQISETLGLSRAPRVVLVDASISPMVWCGLRPTLVLPAGLWSTLDRDSRRAVLVHELAHVRRWDHVLCWLEGMIGALYWWHPVVWWARRRLRDEAEASCDAWVTSLLPSSRKAYASALVATGSYLNFRGPKSGLALGVASSSAKRLARRITMVIGVRRPRRSKAPDPGRR
jgi:bla regulator protein blaR1